MTSKYQFAKSVELPYGTGYMNITVGYYGEPQYVRGTEADAIAFAAKYCAHAGCAKVRVFTADRNRLAHVLTVHADGTVRNTPAFLAAV